MCERTDNKVDAKKSAIGLLPVDRGLDLNGIALSAENIAELTKVDLDEWKAEIPDIEKHFAIFGTRLPERLKKQLKELAERLG